MSSLNRYLKVKQGDEVTIITGAFSDHRGIFECQDDDARIVILLEFNGKRRASAPAVLSDKRLRQRCLDFGPSPFVLWEKPFSP